MLKTLTIFPCFLDKWIVTHADYKFCCTLCERFETKWQINRTLLTKKKKPKCSVSYSNLIWQRLPMSGKSLAYWTLLLCLQCKLIYKQYFCPTGHWAVRTGFSYKNSHETKHRNQAHLYICKWKHRCTHTSLKNMKIISPQQSRVFELSCSLICVVVVPAWLCW